MIIAYCFMKYVSRLRLVLLSVSCVLAWSQVSAQQQESIDEAGAAGATETDEQPLAPESEALARVFAAEVEGGEGDLGAAAQEYLAAALASDDPAVAERATAVALAAQAWQYAAMASDRWVQLAPDSEEALKTAARAQLLAGDYVAAEHHMGALLDLLEEDPLTAWSDVSTLLSLSRHEEKTRGMLEHLVETHDAQDNPYALYARSQVLARSGDLATAFDIARQAAEQASEEAELQAWAGRLAANLGELEAAAVYLESASALNPESTTNALLFANVLRQIDRSDEAHSVLAALPDDPELRFTRIAFALEAGDRELALTLFGGFPEAGYGDDQAAAFQAARSAELLELSEEAIQWYARVHEGQPGLVAVVRRAFLLRDLGRLEEARRVLAEAREVGDGTVRIETLVAESQLLIDERRSAEAYELLELALRQQPDDARLLYTRALVAVELGRIEVAETDLRKVLSQEPQNAAALNALGYTLADRTDRFDEAEQYIRAAFALQPEEASIIDSMGWVAFRQGRLEEAVVFLTEAFERDRNAEIAAHLGEVLWTLGREQEAQAVWLQGRQIDAENRVLKETLRRIGVAF